jgi:hypothetical protein
MLLLFRVASISNEVIMDDGILGVVFSCMRSQDLGTWSTVPFRRFTRAGLTVLQYFWEKAFVAALCSKVTLLWARWLY